mmetsp:Transcript_21862/g.51019  ORF Transcript_21862/g.51019 Transcript_21862/m.51019 type:complete len:295 (+) Transcript_21862:88-972(+)
MVPAFHSLQPLHDPAEELAPSMLFLNKGTHNIPRAIRHQQPLEVLECEITRRLFVRFVERLEEVLWQVRHRYATSGQRALNRAYLHSPVFVRVELVPSYAQQFVLLLGLLSLQVHEASEELRVGNLPRAPDVQLFHDRIDDLVGSTALHEALPELVARKQPVPVGIQDSERLVGAALLARVDLRGHETGDKLLKLGPLTNSEQAVNVSFVQRLEVTTGDKVHIDKPLVLQGHLSCRPLVLHLAEHVPADALRLLRCAAHERPVRLCHDRLGELLYGGGNKGQAAGQQEEEHAAD